MTVGAGPMAPGDLSGPETPDETEMAPRDMTYEYGGARAPLGGFPGPLVTGECD